MSLQVLLFAVVIVSQCIIHSTSLGLPRVEEPTILDIFQKAFVAKKCNTVLIDPDKTEFLSKCNVAVPDLTKNLTADNVISYLCMTYYDVNLKICDRLLTDQTKFLSHLPQTKADIENITSHFDTVEIADDFCKNNHTSIGQSEYEETKQYVKVFAASISEPHLCIHACLDFYGKLNAFCKIIFWATLKLSDHDDATTRYTQMNDIIKQSIKQGSSSSVDQHILSIPVVPKLPISSKQQESALPLNVANGANDDFSLTDSQEIEKNTYNSNVANVAFAVPVKTNTTPKAGAGLPQKPQGPKVEVVALKTLVAEKEVSSKKEAPQEKTYSPEKTISVEKTSAPEKTVIPERQNPEKTTLDKASSTVKVASVEKVPVPILPKLEEEPNSEDEDVESPALLDDAPKSDDFGDDSDSDLPLKGEGEREREGAESAVGAAGGAAPRENPTNEHVGQGYTSDGEFIGAEDSHFFPYFLFASSILIVGYIIFHNKNKVLGLLLEGRRGEGRRRCPGGGPAYRKLDCTLEEAVSSAPPSHNPHIVY